MLFKQKGEAPGARNFLTNTQATGKIHTSCNIYRQAWAPSNKSLPDRRSICRQLNLCLLVLYYLQDTLKGGKDQSRENFETQALGLTRLGKAEPVK